MRIVAAGEAMLELSGAPGGVRLGEGWRLGFGGDTLNTALHLARYGLDVAYLTALGDDRFSDDLCTAWREEGLDTGLVLRDPAKPTGLYAITTDPNGERSFTYWRSDSAARRLFAHPDAQSVIEQAGECDVLVFSLISLAILPMAGREALLALAAAVRARGGKVVFDGNYRPRLWESREEARLWRDRALVQCDLGLPTLEDEIALGGSNDPEAVARAWRQAGASEVVVKLGAAGAFGPDDRTRPPRAVLKPVDTSGAGDAFNAGFLSVWLRGANAEAAVAEGARLAAWVIMRPGAVPERDDGFSYRGAPVV
jgi:2-dehydro-3-deoxygluconokinase